MKENNIIILLTDRYIWMLSHVDEVKAIREKLNEWNSKLGKEYWMIDPDGCVIQKDSDNEPIDIRYFKIEDYD